MAYKSVVVLLLVTVLVTGAVSQQRVCCSCKGPSGPFGVEAPAGFPAKDVCPGSCGPSGGRWTGQVRAGSCSAPPPSSQPTPPLPSFDERVIQAVRWSIGHQGARIWDGDKYWSGEKLLNAVLGPMGPGDNRDRVALYYKQHNNDLSGPVQEGVNRCVAEFPPEQMNHHMQWVCNHEGKSAAIKQKLKSGDMDGIRSEFSLAERGDDRVRNTLYCYNASQVKAFVEGNCR